MDDAVLVKNRLALLLDHLSDVPDPREPAKVHFPLREVLFLVTCASVAGCDDYDEIAYWGEVNLPFLRTYAEYFFGVPKEEWLRTLLNRIDPELFEACFTSWALSLRRDAADLIALDGKTLRRSGDSAAGASPLHLVSAWASTQRLVLAQEPVDAKENECAAILQILKRLSVKGALITIDAIATNPEIASAIIDAGGDYLLALKANQPTFHAEVSKYFDDAPSKEVSTVKTVDKDHGRIETRTTSVSANVSWMLANDERRYPGHPRFASIKTIVKTTTETERRGKITKETRYFICSAALTPERAADAIRSHWGIESYHWVLDVVFKEDLSRLRRGHGARNMALVRRFAFNMVRHGKGKRSIKTTRKAAGWSSDILSNIVTPSEAR
jgi:predicted transposase YbfD/YdcC